MQRGALSPLLVATALASCAAHNPFSSSSNGRSAVRSLVKNLGAEWSRRGGEDVSWDGAVGRVLLSSVRLAVAPATALLAEAGTIDIPWDDDPIDLAAGPLSLGEANVTRLKVEGLGSIGPFELEAGAPGEVEARASFDELTSTMLVDAAISSPLGSGQTTRLRATSVTRDCSATLVLRARLGKRALLELASTFPPRADLAASALSIELRAVRVHIAGDVQVRLEQLEGGGPPAAVWNALSSALQGTLREMVQRQVEESIFESVSELLTARPRSWRSGKGGGGGGSAAADGADAESEHGAGAGDEVNDAQTLDWLVTRS